MMKINPLGTTQTQRTAPKKRKTVQNSGEFSGMLGSVSEAAEAEDISPKPPLSESQSVQTVSSMLTLQEVSDEEVTAKKAMKQGHMTLDALEELRHGLLMGNLPEGAINQLDRMVQQQRQLCSCPKLNSILDDIELRAAVEMAKLEVAKNGVT